MIGYKVRQNVAAWGMYGKGDGGEQSAGGIH